MTARSRFGALLSLSDLVKAEKMRCYEVIKTKDNIEIVFVCVGMSDATFHPHAVVSSSAHKDYHPRAIQIHGRSKFEGRTAHQAPSSSQSICFGDMQQRCCAFGLSGGLHVEDLASVARLQKRPTPELREASTQLDPLRPYCILLLPIGAIPDWSHIRRSVSYGIKRL